MNWNTLPSIEGDVEFFRAFSRFEYAMKASCFLKRHTNGEAKPDWDKLANCLGPRLLKDSPSEETKAAVKYLEEESPKKQVVIDDALTFTDAKLGNNDGGCNAIKAICRVRNNLFHGGKQVEGEDKERDCKLIKCSLVVLKRCLSLNSDLERNFQD